MKKFASVLVLALMAVLMLSALTFSACGDDEEGGNGSQSGQDFYDYIECFHGNDLQNFLDSGADLRRCDFYTPSITNVVKKSNT